MAEKLLHIPNDETQNYTFCRSKLVVETFETLLNELTNQNSLKSPKLLGQRTRKRYCPLSLWNNDRGPVAIISPQVQYIKHNLQIESFNVKDDVWVWEFYITRNRDTDFNWILFSFKKSIFKIRSEELSVAVY